MVVVVTLILLALVVAFVGYPLLRPSPPATAEGPAAGQRDQLLSERENALEALQDLELEHSIGNLSRDDYDALRAAQRRKAVAILRELDEVRDAVDVPTDAPPSVLDNLALDARLEEQIARARRRLESGPRDTAETEPACPTCGAPHAPTARFCSECGARFDADALACPACATPRSPRDKFCPGCGTAFVEEHQRDQ